MSCGPIFAYLSIYPQKPNEFSHHSADSIQWGKTAAELPKLQDLGLWGQSYEALVRQALGGDKILASYLAWLRSHFEAAYTRRGPCSKGIDFAGYLTHIRFQAPVDSDGFRRRFV